MSEVLEPGSGNAAPKDPKMFKCRWSSCAGEHLEELKEVEKPNLENYPDNGRYEKGGYRDAWIAAGWCPWGTPHPPAAAYTLPRQGLLTIRGNPIKRNFWQFEAHHIIPSTLLKKTSTLKSNCKLIGYSVDHRNNGMILPKHHMDQPIHQLPRHRGSHPSAYMTPIKESLQVIEEDYDGICENDATGNLGPQACLVAELDFLSSEIQAKIMNIRVGKDFLPLRSAASAEFPAAEADYQRRIAFYKAKQKAGK